MRKGISRTEHASRYLQQLCKHWSHKFEVVFDPAHGTVHLPAGRLDLAAFADHMEVTLSSPEPDRMDALQKVTTDHLDRFAFREAPLPFSWQDVEPSA